MREVKPAPAETGFRFRAPEVEPGPETLWCLWRAFGALDAKPPLTFVRDLAFDEAATLGLASRIGAWVPHEVLAGELGTEQADRFAAARRATASRALRYEQLAAELCEVAQRLGIPVFFLKGLALHLAEHAALGSRAFGDLDLLASEHGARELWQTLVDSGMEAAPGEPNEQHLPPLSSEVWGVVDVHFALHGVWHPDGGWWTADRLLEGGLVAPTRAISGGHVPVRDVLAAHCLVHGIEQHGLAPGRHSLLRMLADIQDLLPDPASWRSFLDARGAWLARSISLLELEAVHELRLALEAGGLPERGSVERRLLDHLLCAARDEGYRASLARRHLLWRMRRARQEGRLIRYILRKLPKRRRQGDPRG
ncbi:MAG: nucleotidyltransferase family protein [Thermoanaerobaculia bacterium]